MQGRDTAGRTRERQISRGNRFWACPKICREWPLLTTSDHTRYSRWSVADQSLISRGKTSYDRDYTRNFAGTSRAVAAIRGCTAAGPRAFTCVARISACALGPIYIAYLSNPGITPACSLHTINITPASAYDQHGPSYPRTHAPATASVALDRCPSAATEKNKKKRSICPVILQTKNKVTFYNQM